MYIRIDVTPEAKANTIKRLTSEKFELTVKDKAEHNLANKKALEILADQLKIPVARLRIINGHHTSRKLVSILDERPEEKESKNPEPKDGPLHRNFKFKI